MSTGSIFALVFGLLAIGFGLLAVGFTVSRRRFLARAQRVEGVVVDRRERRRGSGATRRTVYHPVVRYSFGGADLQVEGSVGYGTPVPHGTTIFVLVDPSSPNIALLDAFPDLWSTVVISTVTSAVFFVASAVTLALG